MVQPWNKIVATWGQYQDKLKNLPPTGFWSTILEDFSIGPPSRNHYKIQSLYFLSLPGYFEVQLMTKSLEVERRTLGRGFRLLLKRWDEGKVGDLTIRIGFWGVPYYHCSIIYPKPYSNE